MIRRWKPGVTPGIDTHYVRLLLGDARTFRLVVVNENGVPQLRGNLLFFMPNGEVHRAPGVNLDFGFSQTPDGRLRVESGEGNTRRIDDFVPSYNPWMFYGGRIRWDKVKLTLRDNGEGVYVILVTGTQTLFGLVLTGSGSITLCASAVTVYASDPRFTRLLPCNINRALIVI